MTAMPRSIQRSLSYKREARYPDNNKGGRFMVPLSINTKIVFVRVDNEAERLEFADPVHFPPNPLNRWSYRTPAGKRLGPVMVDTDWDGTPDTALPGQSNFAPGLRDGLNKLTYEGTHAVAPAEP
jgi:hypothetical protein